MDTTRADTGFRASEANPADSRPSGFRAGVVELLRTVGPPFFGAMAVVVAIASVIGLVLTHVVDQTAFVRWDERLVETLEANRTERLTSITGVGTFVADPLPVAVLWALAVIVLAIATRHWRPPFFVMVAIGGEKLSYIISTLIVDRPRPEVETIGKLPVTSSFPSGHVGSAVSLYAGVTVLACALATGRLRRAHVWTAVVVGVAFAAIVGYSRMYRGHHFLTDIVVGMLIGFAWVVIAYRYVLRPYLDDRGRGAAHTDASRLAV